jgi:hypothetical protein
MGGLVAGKIFLPLYLVLAGVGSIFRAPVKTGSRGYADSGQQLSQETGQRTFHLQKPLRVQPGEDQPVAVQEWMV